MQPSSCALPLGLLLLASLSAVAGCSSLRESRPEETATEQLLVSTAAERAAESMAAALPVDGSIFLEPANFDGSAGRYALAAIREALARRGLSVARDRSQAKTVVEVRVGALSVDDSETMIGVPSIAVPVPLADHLQSPELALFGRDLAQGVAQFSAAAYDSATGTFVASSGPHFGFAHQTNWTLLVAFSWTTDDLKPEAESKPSPLAFTD